MEQNTRSRISDINPDAIILDGFDDAIIGMSECGEGNLPHRHYAEDISSRA